MWLSWKMKHGLASRGRAAPFKPTGMLANILYYSYFKFRETTEPEETSAIIFTQHVGGSLGPSGDVNK